MEVPAASTSLSLHFPPNFVGKPKPRFQLQILVNNNASFWCRTFRTQTPFSASNLYSTSFSVSSTCTCTDESDQGPVSLNNPKDWVHFVGIGGCGLSALAMLALKQSYEVSGSDIAWSSFMDGLQEAGARIYIGHTVSNMQKEKSSALPNAIVVSSAIPQDNVEILYAKSVGVPVYKRDYWLEKLTQCYNLIAVSGTHGKSTTASMLAYVLHAMGDDLTTVVGAHVPQFGGKNVMSGGSQTFVLEADEYDGSFLKLSPYITVVTNLEWEHVDTFQDEEAVKTTFRRFLNQIRKGGHLILCGDSQGACSLLNYNKQETGSDASIGTMSIPSVELCNSGSYKITSYGITSSNEWQASSICPNTKGGSNYTLNHWGFPVADISIQIPGVHNVLNSLAVIATVVALINDERKLYDAITHMRMHLQNFIGVSRRFEMIGSIYGCQIYDDYAHHPTEVRAVLQAARQRFPYKALLVVFQPHTYSRLAALKDDFANALGDADQVVVTAVYACRETNVWNVSGRELAASIIGPPSDYIPSLCEVHLYYDDSVYARELAKAFANLRKLTMNDIGKEVWEPSYEKHIGIKGKPDDGVVDELVLQICKEPHRDIVVLTLGAGDITTVGPKLLNELKERKDY